MAKYSAEGLVSVTYYVEGVSSAEEAEEKIRDGECEQDYGAIDQLDTPSFISGEGDERCVGCGEQLETEEDIQTGKCYDCLVIDNETDGEGV